MRKGENSQVIPQTFLTDEVERIAEELGSKKVHEAGFDYLDWVSKYSKEQVLAILDQAGDLHLGSPRNYVSDYHKYPVTVEQYLSSLAGWILLANLSLRGKR